MSTASNPPPPADGREERPTVSLRGNQSPAAPLESHGSRHTLPAEEEARTNHEPEPLSTVPPTEEQNGPPAVTPPTDRTPPDAVAADDLPDSTLLSGEIRFDLPIPPLKATAPTGYEIVGQLGYGGMGVVYKARQIKANREVALKMILAHTNASLEQKVRFRIEAETVARFQHVNIVQLYDVGEHEGSPFFSLEFCGGGTLDEMLEKKRPSPHEAAALVETLARATHYAHLRGVIHRDLKPANVLLTVDGTPKIADFGLAKRLDLTADVGSEGKAIGTPQYMAPEQAEGRLNDIGPATDTYALGAILYELLTGRPPFDGPPHIAMVNVLRRDPESPDMLRRGLPKDLVTICLKCLSKAPAKRYASAEALADDLRRFRSGEPITARRTGRLERMRKWARRKPALALAVVLLGVTIVALAAGGTVYGLYADQQATAVKRKLERRDKFDTLRREADEAEQHGELLEAESKLREANGLVMGDPEGFDSEARPRLKKDLARVQDKLAAERQTLDQDRDKKKKRLDFAERLDNFDTPRAQALLHSLSFRQETIANDSAIVRREAKKALEQLRLDVTKPPADFAADLKVFRPVVKDPAQVDRVATECYELLLAWAEAEAAPRGGTRDPGADPKHALQLLDAAEGLAGVSDFGIPTPRAYHLRRARYHEMLGDRSAADAARAAASKIEPTTTLDLLESALDHYRKGELNEAAGKCGDILHPEVKDPKRPLPEPNFWAEYILSLCHMRRHLWNEAIVHLSACLHMRPTSGTLHMHRALAHVSAADDLLKNRRNDLGETELNRLDEIVRKHNQQAVADFEQAWSSARNDDFRAIVLTNRATMWMLQKEWTKARDDLLKAGELQGETFHGYHILAQVYAELGKLDNAIAAMDRAIAIQPDWAGLYLIRSRYHRKHSDDKAARKDLEEYLKRERANPAERAEASVELAVLKQQANDLAGSLADCATALRLKPSYAPAYRQQSLVLQTQGDYEQAEKALRKYIDVGGLMTADDYRRYGLIYTRLAVKTATDERRGPARRSEFLVFNALAVAKFTDALALRKDAETFALRGQAFLAQDAGGPALDDFDAALKLDRTHGDALRGRALALVLLDRTREVEDAVDAALTSGPRTPDALVQTAYVCSEALRRIGLRRDRTPEETAVAERCQARALNLITEALDRCGNEADKRKFWESRVKNSFQPLRDASRFKELAKAYGGN
jgi:tetratricopeptide (TPR) repeat protein/tRNA A-37 threonylcarbamoyl transferase component Bud32